MKSVNLDSRSRKRIRYASAKERSKKATADVYRSYKDRIAGGVTSAATRERFVHNPQSQQRPNKRQRGQQHSTRTDDRSSKDRAKTAVVTLSKKDDDNVNDTKSIHDAKLAEILDQDQENEEIRSSTFANELDVAMDRNASEIFGKFNRQVWLLVRSLPELLHNLPKVIDILMSYMLSPSSLPGQPTPLPNSVDSDDNLHNFVVNLATTDILHLLSVLARDLRSEIHPYLHTKILPRIVTDLLNPPAPPPESEKQPIPLDVTVVEASFRCLAYVFKYDSDLVVNDMESMRQYYGKTLGNRRELIRRLSAETFAPLIRKMNSKKNRERHLRRVFRALVATSKHPSSRILVRTQTDAVDGLSQLCFQIVRGTADKLHSDGSPMLRFIFQYLVRYSDNTNDENVKVATRESKDLIFGVVSGMLEKLSYHCNSSTFPIVSKELFAVFHEAVFEYRPNTKETTMDTPGFLIQSIFKILQLIVNMSTRRSGYLLEQHDDKELQPLCDAVSRVCSKRFFDSFPMNHRSDILELLCELWISLQNRKCVKIREHVRIVLDLEFESRSSLLCTSVVVAKKLLPSIHDNSVLMEISSLLVLVAAELAEESADEALQLIFAVSSCHCREDSERESSDSFSLFGQSITQSNMISFEQQESLFDACLLDSKVTLENQARISVALRCAPFIFSSHRQGATKQYKRVSKWIMGLMDSADIEISCLIMSLAIESLVSVSMVYLECNQDSLFVKKMMDRANDMASKMLVGKNCGSPWVARSVASLLPLLQKFNIRFSVDDDALFDALTPNLRKPNHFLRLYTLQILSSCPVKMFVVDHADLDLSEDLDEEETSGTPAESILPRGGPVGQCHLVETLLKFETAQIGLAKEKELVALLGTVQVLARSGRLPVQYAEAACYYMLGVLRIKFSPLWPVAQKTLEILLREHEKTVWPSFEAELLAVMRRDPFTVDLTEKQDRSKDFLIFEEHLELCCAWERSSGRDNALFRDESVVEEGVVLKTTATDETTVMESVWKVAQMSQSVIAKHSRLVVPLFLGFVHNQLFPTQSNDQDARELHLENVVSSEKPCCTEGHIIKRRLKAFLSVFASIDGPEQLVQHRLLEKIFRSLLTDQDTAVVELTLSCLEKFKIPPVLRYKGMMCKILQKGRLRHALLDFSDEVSSERLDQDERKLLIPILSRILFGRIGAKTGKSSSKDSPKARRAAVLSFLAALCKNDSDLFPFLYLMTRPFVPDTIALEAIESFEPCGQTMVMQSLMSTQFDRAPPSGPIIEGFLRLLESVISQLGYRVIGWVPQLTSITIEICLLVPANVGASVQTGSFNNGQTRSILDTFRHGAIRSLCFHRLSDIFSRFATALDFDQFSSRLWKALDPSLRLLPETVVRSQDCPALLTLLRIMSEHVELIDLLLEHHEATGAVVGCIAETSRHSVMDSSLSFIENLLGIKDGAKGELAVLKFAPKIVDQFTKRFGGKGSDDVAEASDGRIKTGSGTKSPTWRRELQILCDVSGLSDSCDSHLAESLFSLLVPYLRPDQGTSDDEKAKIINILSNIATQLNAKVAESAISSLSICFSPNKSKEGIKSPSIRSCISVLLDHLAGKCPRFQRVSAFLVKISSVDQKRVDELDFEIVIPALSSLAERKDGSLWKSLISAEESDPLDLISLVNCCFHLLYSDDGVVSRASFNGIRQLITTSGESYYDASIDHVKFGWRKLVESVVAPCTKHGLESRNMQVRRFCTLLVRETAKSFRRANSEFIYGDLWRFCDEENEDLDFFLGITHVQVHRRARAFRRMRKSLGEYGSSSSSVELSSQSLVNVLIPLTLHPLYESNTKSEEGLALEAIATLGALSRHLSWSKYSNVLWSILIHLDRHPNQERYLVGALCAMIDSFGYDMVAEAEDAQQTKTSVWRSLENRIIPKMESILTKETTDKNGSRIKSLRPTIILALTTLFQKFPVDFFEIKLSNIIAVVCDVLRSKDSNSRDVARTTLAKIVCSMDLKYLGDVIRELAITLTEGYKLHVRAAALHTILLELSKVYETPSRQGPKISLPSFDRAVPALMELLQDDLFGEASERRESTETSVRFVKEASGNKSVHSIEMVSRMILFSPSSLSSGDKSTSSVHCVISPFLERLMFPDIDAKSIRKIKEVLTRIGVGITSNKSVVAEELLPFVYATILPFVSKEAVDSVMDGTAFVRNDDDDEADNEFMVQVSGRVPSKKNLPVSQSMKARADVVEWRPSTLQSSISGKIAIGMKSKMERQIRLVQDGSSAPKLTGTSRHGTVESVDRRAVNTPAASCGVVFGLSLLSAFLKKNMFFDKGDYTMLDAFVPILVALVCCCPDTEIALLAMKCLNTILRFDLPSVQNCSRSLGSQTLQLLSSSASTSKQNDLTQTCFKTLTYLVSCDDDTPHLDKSVKLGEQVSAIRSRMPLDSEQLKVLCDLLQASIVETEQHNPALNLIKALISHRYSSPEFYDLMDSILKLVVRSSKPTLRQQASGLFVRYLFEYPMGDERLEQHLRQAIANISYEYQEGRLSGIGLVILIIEKFPQQLLEKYAQLFFLPLVMQLLNDESKDCRKKVGDCIKLIFSLSPPELLRTYQDYCSKWSKQAGQLCLASLQVRILLIESRPELVQSSSEIKEWIGHLRSNLQHRKESNDWETAYFSLVSIEKLLGGFESKLSQEAGLWTSVTDCLTDDHPWIKLSSSRIVRDLFSADFAKELCTKKDGFLFDVVRNLCFQLNAPEEAQNEELTDIATKTMSLLLPLMKDHPELCYQDEREGSKQDDDACRDPIFWLMRRLSQIVKGKGAKRRVAIFKCYAAFATTNFSIVAPHLDLMLDGLHRVVTEGKNELDNLAFSQRKRPKQTVVSESVDVTDASFLSSSDECTVAEEVLHLLEESCTSPEQFLSVYASVKRRAREKKDKRKADEKAQAVVNPQGFAERKIHKQVVNKERKKRRAQEQRRDRGGLDKRLRIS